MAQKASGKTRRTPRQQRARTTVDVILLAAAHILRTEGAERLTTNRIAQLAGVSIGSLYQYFPDKQAIVEALGERHEDWYEQKRRAWILELRGVGLRESVLRAVEEAVAMHRIDPALHNAVSDDRCPLASEMEARFREMLRLRLEERDPDRRPPDTELASFLAIRALQAVIHGTTLDAPERLSHPLFAKEVTELFLRYLER